MPRVLIVDDDHLVRRGIAAVLAREWKIDLVGEAANGREAIDRVRELGPDVVLMDVCTPGFDGIAVTRELKGCAPETKVLILTTLEQNDYIFGALRAGASGFLLRRTSPEELIAAIHTIADGGSMLSPSITRRVIEEVARQPVMMINAESKFQELTVREQEVCVLIAQGLSNMEIARVLTIEESTVKTHVRRILLKLGLRDRIQVAITAHQTGVAYRTR
jgi:DNA-binding NarL/FixJ family response regulator